MSTVTAILGKRERMSTVTTVLCVCVCEREREREREREDGYTDDRFGKERE